MKNTTEFGDASFWTRLSKDKSQGTDRRLVLALLLMASVCLGGCGIAPDKVEVGETEKKQIDPTQLQKLDPGSYMQTWQMQDGRVVSFTISIPETYVEEKPTPLVLALHYGADQMSQFFGSQMLHGMVGPATQELDAILVAPDVVNKSWVNFRCEECVMGLMNEMCKTYNVDRSKILVVGFSLGATGVWHYAKKHPDFFTAAIPIAGHPPVDYMDSRWTVPMLAIHSDADEVFPFNTVNDAIQRLQARGDQVQLFALENISHYQTNKFVEPLKQAVDWVKQVWEANSGN